MQYIESLKLALQSLWANKLRSILTVLGVVMGVSSVIMVITLVNGTYVFVSTKLTGYGADVFTIDRQSSVIFNAEDYFRFQKRKLIRFDDYQAILSSCRGCREVGTDIGTMGKVVYGHHSSGNSRLRGYTSSMFSLHNINIAEGRAFTPTDEDHATHIAVIGGDIVDNLFDGKDALDEEIRVNGVPYTVVGVAEKLGSTLGQSQDNWVAIPVETYQQVNGSNDSLSIYVRGGTDTSSLERAKDEVRALMRARRHDAPGADDSFELQSNDTFLDIWKSFSQMFSTVVVGLASISLVVGGIVIMNIMLVSVTERTREIGVRKALGAKYRDILLQFLMESSVLSLIGGGVGVFIGIVLAKLITLVTGFPTAVSFASVFLSLFVATGVGLFFGIYPASKAAKLDPITALRAEL